MKLSKNKAFAGVMSLVMAGSSFLPGVRAEDDLKTKAINFVKSWTPTASLGLTAIGTTAGIASLIFCALNTTSRDKRTEELDKLVKGLEEKAKNNKDYTKEIGELSKQIEQLGKEVNDSPNKLGLGNIKSLLVLFVRNELLFKDLNAVWEEFIKPNNGKTEQFTFSNNNSSKALVFECFYRGVINTSIVYKNVEFGNNLLAIFLDVVKGGNVKSITVNKNFNNGNLIKNMSDKIDQLRASYGDDLIKEAIKGFFAEKLNSLVKEIQDKKLSEEKAKKEQEEQEKSKQQSTEKNENEQTKTNTEGNENKQKETTTTEEKK